MKKTTETAHTHLPCGMVSLKMFQINHSKALIIAYLDLRGGLKKYTYNLKDIINQTGIGRTTVRECLKELVSEGVLNRRGNSFYKLNRQRMEELYYTEQSVNSDTVEGLQYLTEDEALALDTSFGVSGNDLNVSNSDSDISKNDSHRPKSDPKVSESDPIHSSNLNSRKLDTKKLESSNLDTSGNSALEQSPVIRKFLGKSPKEQNELLDTIEANKTMEKDLRSGEEVMWTAKFVETLANW